MLKQEETIFLIHNNSNINNKVDKKDGVVNRLVLEEVAKEEVVDGEVNKDGEGNSNSKEEDGEVSKEEVGEVSKVGENDLFERQFNNLNYFNENIF